MNRVIISLVFVVLGLLVILVPTYLLPVCAPMEVISPVVNVQAPAHVTVKYMKCHWTGQAEMGIGAVIMALGLLMLLSRSACVRLGLSLSVICVAMLAAAIPTVLIGVCPGEMMPCHMGTLPSLLLLSGLLVVIALINVLYLNRSHRQ